MSSVWNHAPSRSGVSSLRAAPLLAWSKPQGNRCSNGRFTRYRASGLNLHNASPCPRWFRFLTSASGTGSPASESQNERQEGDNSDRKNSLNDWWVGVRHQSQLNQLYAPEQEERNEDGGRTPPQPPYRTKEQDRLLRSNGPLNRRQRKSKLPSSPTPSDYLLEALEFGPHKCVHRKPGRLSFQTIIVDYLSLVEPILEQKNGPYHEENLDPALLDDALKEAFCEANLQYLSSRQYDATDVVSWTWILKSKTTYEAISRIFILEEAQRNQYGADVQGVPPFIPLLLLRQPRFDVKTFRLLLVYSLHLMSGQLLPPLYSLGSLPEEVELSTEPPSGKPPIDPSMCMSFIVRLLRHARQVWPQAQLSIARSFSHYLTHLSLGDDCLEDAVERMNRFRAEKFNICLWVLSWPSKPNPFASISIQQQAQFEILKAMAGHKPVLPVTRLGYQGVIATQLAHKKTPAERQSARLKTASWPPWKEEKLGIDSQRGNEGLKSRAMRVMSQMIEAGYSLTRLEEVTAILAGWDTDRSPTIQTRALMRRPQSLPGPLGSNPDHQAIWVARIRATRTVREAWACFLSYQDQGLPPRPSIYAAMAEKLIFRKKAVESQFDEISSALPGDGPEVFPEPLSARDLIYVHTEPPTLDELLKQMQAQGIRPTGKFLGLLLRNARSFTSGLEYLRSSDLPSDQIRALCTIQTHRLDYEVDEQQQSISELPDKLFSSFIAFLCRFSCLDPLYHAHHNIRTTDLFPIVMFNPRATISPQTSTLFSYAESSNTPSVLHHPKTLSHAIQLVKLRNSSHPSSWIHLLQALGNDRINVPYRRMSRTARHILAWHEVLEITGLMETRKVEPGLHGFHVLCTTFSKAVIAGVQRPSAAEDGLDLINEAKRLGNLPHVKEVTRTFDGMVQAGLYILMKNFDRLVLPDPRATNENKTAVNDSQVSVPPMLHVPSPAILHAFVRALGIAEDYESLLYLLRWMSQSAATLKEAADEYLNGERMMRRTLVAMRVFIEGPPWGSKRTVRAAHDPEELVFADPVVKEAFDVISMNELWGGWPSDDEVWEYVHWTG